MVNCPLEAAFVVESVVSVTFMHPAGSGNNDGQGGEVAKETQETQELHMSQGSQGSQQGSQGRQGWRDLIIVHS